MENTATSNPPRTSTLRWAVALLAGGVVLVLLDRFAFGDDTRQALRQGLVFVVLVAALGGAERWRARRR